MSICSGYDVSFVSEMTWTGRILFFSVFLLLFSKSYCEFPTNFLGNYLSDEEYENSNFCWTELCMKDSGRLIEAADHNSNKTLPCDDFKTFAMGNFFEHRVPNDRYRILGFFLDVNLQFDEKQKRILLKPVNETEPKMFKVMKRFFQRCINTRKTLC